MGGAAASTLVGEIASDDAGKEAAIGAAVGFLGGRRMVRAQVGRSIPSVFMRDRSVLGFSPR